MKRYSNYRESGIEWIGELPEHWEISRAKNYFSQSFEKGNEELTLLSATQSDGVVPKDSLEGVVQVREDADLSLFKSVHVGDYVISLRSFQGGFEMSNHEGVITPAYTVFRAKNEICHRYFQKLFKQEAFISKINSLTVGIREGKNILFQDFANMVIPFPPLSEQTAIADYLERKMAQIDSIITDKQRLIELLREKRLIIISEAVTKGLNKNVNLKDSGIKWIGEMPIGWSRSKLKNVLSTPITDGPHETPEILDDGIPFVSAEAVKNYKIDFNYKRGYISKDDHKRFSKKCKPQNGDIFMVKSGATTGNIAMVDTNEIFSVWSPLALIRCDDKKVVNKFLFFYLQSKLFKQQVELFWNYGTQQNIGMEVLGNLYVAFPTTIEQEEIVRFIKNKVEKIDNIIADITEQIEKLNEYHKIVMSEAVTGKIKIAEDGECNVN